MPHRLKHLVNVRQAQPSIVGRLMGLQQERRISGDLIPLDCVFLGVIGAHVFDEGLRDGRRYFQLFPGHGFDISTSPGKRLHQPAYHLVDQPDDYRKPTERNRDDQSSKRYPYQAITKGHGRISGV
jgi:hypothetical protein